ncbi:MAG TPA: 50S ribosomal protein L15 [Patescibacteria group bacterium]|nr:50S ribosomal protein L15 [Patescibacteria group bacterium]
MELHQLSTISHKDKRRLGQGHGSGRVKTAGRGTKGQKARYDIPLDFEGGALPLIKRLPFLRGKDRNKSLQAKPVVITLQQLNQLPKDTEVTLESLAQHKLISLTEGQLHGVKVLGDGNLSVALTVKVATSKNAEEKIVKAGGKVEPVLTSVSVSA